MKELFLIQTIVNPHIWMQKEKNKLRHTPQLSGVLQFANEKTMTRSTTRVLVPMVATILKEEVNFNPENFSKVEIPSVNP